MKHALTLLWVLILSASGRSFAQTSFCHFDSLWNEKAVEDSMLPHKHNAHVSRVNQFRQNTQLNHNVIPYGVLPQGLGSGPGCRNAIFVIPVVVHVVYDPNIPQSNLHDSLVEKQIEILNKAFANEVNLSSPFGVNTGIQFCLAQKNPFGGNISGINHISDANPVNSIFNNAQKNHLAGLVYYDNQRYLNIWVVPDIDGAAGYSNTPYMNGVDGVVMEYDYFGDYTDCSTCGFDNMSRGLILAHEVGHYLGLFHPFQEECVGTTASTCSVQGDFCCDTRPTKENHNCPVPSINQCPSLPYYGSQKDNYENFMAYADDACRDNFTPDQVSVMQSVLSNDRKGLVSADNVNSLALSCCLTASWFNISNGFLCLPELITFNAIEHTGADYRWRVYTDNDTLVLDTTLSVASFSWNLSRYGKYHVKLFVITGTDSVVLERTNLLELRDCGPVLSSSQGNWYFGKYAGLQFRTGGPVLDRAAFDGPPPTVKSGDGGISHSNSSGSILFYAGGDSTGQNVLRLYKPDPITGLHVQVFPSMPLYGHQSSSQTGIVIPFKHDSTRFHLFVTDAAYELEGGCYHNVLDIDTPNLAMTGSINLPLPVPSGSYTNAKGSVLTQEMITTVPACDSNYWLIVADGASNSYANSGQLLVYLVTDSTVTYVTKSDDRVPTYFGQLKASPDGTKLAAPGAVFNFDRTTGNITTLKKLPDDGRYVRYHGTSFSPDSRLLYYVVEEDAAMHIYQYDLESSDSLLSRQRVTTESTFFTTALQLGPDGKLYVTKPNYDELAVIANPNERINPLNPNACGFDAMGPSLKDIDGNGGTCYAGLPNMMDAKYPQNVPLDFSILDSSCGIVKFFPNDACAGTYLWHFGDGDSSINKFPVHSYANPGVYQVTLTVNGLSQKSRSLKIGIDKPQIAGDTIVSCNLDDITVYSIANLDPELNYSWWTSGGEVKFIEDFENAHIQWDTSGYLFIHALSSKNGCTSIDSQAIFIGDIRNNSYNYNEQPCFPGDTFSILGNIPSINFMDTSLHYQWQIWNDSIWQNTSSQDSFPSIIELTASYDSLWFRRKVFNQYCENFSDSLLVAPRVRITQSPKDVSKCVGDGETVEVFHLGTEFTSWEPMKAYFIVKKFIQSSGFQYVVEDSIVELSDPYSLDSIVYELGHYSSEYFFQIETPCGNYYSDTALLYACYPENSSHWTITLPDTTYAAEDSLVQLITHYNHCNDGPPLKGSYVYWQYSNNGTAWHTINDTCGDTLRFVASSCENGLYYRMVYHEPCFEEDRYSPVGRLFVTQSNFAKLMMRDYWDDEGTEPNNNTDWRNLYEPPSLLIRLSPDGGTQHEIPDWGNSDTAFVYYTIRNIDSVHTSKPAKLKLYWTSGGPNGADWTIAWSDTTGNRFQNLDPASGLFYGNWYPYGDRINEIPIEVPPIDPGDSIRDYFIWTTYPNPMRYYTFQNGQYVYNNPRMMCLLARIETCPLDSFGMSFKETNATRQNIINNRKIVGRNSFVRNQLGLFGKKDFPLTIRRFGGDTNPIKLSLEEVGNCGFTSYGTIRAIASDGLWQAWADGGYSGSGFSIESANVLVITDISDFEISNIDLPADSVSLLRFEFELTSKPPVTLNCRYVAAQYQGNYAVIPYGSFVMDLEALGGPVSVERTVSGQDNLIKSTEPYSSLNQSEELKDSLAQTESLDPSQNNLKAGSLFAYPNPFSHEVNFFFELNSNQFVSIEVYNGLGISVGKIESREFNKGKHSMAFDGSKLSPGMYLAKVQIGEQVSTLRLLLAR